MKLEDAIKENFARCTRNELRLFCKDAGVRIGPAAGPEMMRRGLLEHFAITDSTPGVVKADRVVKYRARNEILPPYNLTPEGSWGGRRRRITLGKPLDATKNQKAELISWNCKNPYRVPFNEIEAVPEPIYNTLMEKRRSIPTPVINPQNGEQSTQWIQEPKWPLSDHGVDPDTAGLAGSLREWYQGKGPNWLRERSLVDLQQIADHCGIERQVYRGADAGKPRLMTLAELLPHLMIQFFDFPDVGEYEEDEDEIVAKGKGKAA